jgi:hypothetical protein
LDNKKKFLLILVALSVLLYLWLTAAITGGDPWIAALVCWVSSPILFLCLAYFFETSSTGSGRGASFGSAFKSVFSLKKQALSFIIGDILLLPAAAWLAADKWSQATDRSGLTWSWWVLSLLLGGIAGAAFHYLLDKPGYTNRGYASNLDSPTKLFHDFVSYPVLFGGLLYAFIPLVGATWINGHTIPIVLLIAGWAVLGKKVDGDRAGTLVPWGHPAFDWNELSVPQH